MTHFYFKTRLFASFFLLSITATAQITTPAITKLHNPFIGKYDWIAYTSQYLAGAADGTREQVLYHPRQIFALYPRLNRQWWDSRISWKNKEHESPLLVEFSDANHFFESASRGFGCVSVAFSFNDWNNCKKNQRWVVIGKKILLSYISNKLGFITTYHEVFENKLYM